MKSTLDYCVLGKDERLTLFLKAASRDDTQEMQKVIAASPRVEMKLVDFFADVYALVCATILHSLGQANLLSAIRDLWGDRDNDESFLCAVSRAHHYVVSEEAWRLICKEHGVDYDRLLTMWADFAYVNSNPSHVELAKKLTLIKTEYKVSPTSTVGLKVPTIEEKMKDHRKMIAFFREQFG